MMHSSLKAFTYSPRESTNAKIMIAKERKMETTKLELAQKFLRTMDEAGNVFELLTDDVEVMYPKWGIAKGKEDLAQLYTDLGPYLSSISHHAESFRCLTGDDQVCISGLSSGTLTDGRRWEPDGACGGQFCVWFSFREELISGIWIYIDPDYVDGTKGYYPWSR
ncbi:nuclear transport factor 2 family protein [Aquisediminimonas profunda]|uniref:nuclear transport factor 2 family protein n=1 Tax=Aquisediminimonas profunda TaxID=1550733 RepID=UPI001C630E49|nr:hypothetical protein [Aquisediminimonas profunda]